MSYTCRTKSIKMQQQSALVELQQLLSTPPPSLEACHRINPIAVAHAALEELRGSGDERFLFLRSIQEIESSSSGSHLRVDQEELFFHCITGVRQTTLWKWRSFSLVYLQNLRDYFMTLGATSFLASSGTCRMACFTTAVSFWKRGWNSDFAPHPNLGVSASRPEQSSEEAALLQRLNKMQFSVFDQRDQLFQFVEANLTSSSAASEQLCSFLACLVGEFSGKSAVAYRMPMEFHRDAHMAFEKAPLLESLRYSLNALGSFVAKCNSASVPYASDVVKEGRASIHLALEVLGWEFGSLAFATGTVGASRIGQVLLRPPVEWRQYLTQVDLVRALFTTHNAVASVHTEIAALLRQLLLALASLSGPIFAPHNLSNERQVFASTFMEGTLSLMQNHAGGADNAFLNDIMHIMCRLVTNFKLPLLIGSQSLNPALESVVATGVKLLSEQVQDCESVEGDLDAIELREEREETLSLLLETLVLLCGDPWLQFAGSNESRAAAATSLFGLLGPLYTSFIDSRLKIAALEERFNALHEVDVDDVHEMIQESDLDDEITSIATIGRLDLSSAIQCLSGMFASASPILTQMWQHHDNVTPTSAATLEQVRLLLLHLTALVTDKNDGESPEVPAAVMSACQQKRDVATQLASSVQAVLLFADSQVKLIRENPSNGLLSPFLACTFLQFLKQWAPSYISPGSGDKGGILPWSALEPAQQAITFSIQLCVQYRCLWPQEPQVQRLVGDVLLSLARSKSSIRLILPTVEPFTVLVKLHCITTDLPHSASQDDIRNALSRHVASGIPTPNMVWGYHRLSYGERRRTLSAIVLACAESQDQATGAMLQSTFNTLQDSFSALLGALNAPGSEQAVTTREGICLCLELMCGVATCSSMTAPERVPAFLNPYHMHISSLMDKFSQDLTICEVILRFFSDYTEHFIAILDRDQSAALFTATAQLLKLYSANVCKNRSIVKRSSIEAEADEEKAYGDVLCAIRLLTNLGTKDFVDASSGDGIESNQVTDMVFFGLQQLLPLMSKGLLEFPGLSLAYFELMGFVAETYPDRVCQLPFDLFCGILESLIFGMNHHSTTIANSSLQGISSIAREQVKSRSLDTHLSQHPDIFDECSRRLIADVVLQSSVHDRSEAVSMALLPLAAVNVERFSRVVDGVVAQVSNQVHMTRLRSAFNTLIQSESLSKVSAQGHEGRTNRLHFKLRFDQFVTDVHSFLVIR